MARVKISQDKESVADLVDPPVPRCGQHVYAGPLSGVVFGHGYNADHVYCCRVSWSGRWPELVPCADLTVAPPAP